MERVVRLFAILPVVVVLGACPSAPLPPPPGPGEGEGEGPGEGEGEEPEPDLTPLAFVPDHVLEIEIEMDPGDFALLSEETRSFVDIFEPGCVDQPFPSPFNEYEASVTIDGERFERVNVKKKGFLGSLSQVKPGIKIDMNDFDPDLDYFGLDKLTFNNVPQDPTYVRTCLAYQVFNAAGATAPRCSFAHITINGEDKGVYVHVETVSKGFAKRRFGDGDGNLYEGTLSDFTPEWENTFERETNEGDPDAPEVTRLVEALQSEDDVLLVELQDVMDVEEFLTFWASEVLLGHWDGYSGNQNNFFLYGDPDDGDKAHFIAWGADSTMAPSILGYQGGPQPLSVAAYGFLTRRIYNHPEGRVLYLAELQRILDEVWDESFLLDELARMDTLIDPFLFEEERQRQEDGVTASRAFIEGRRAALEADIPNAIDEWQEPFRLPFCAAPAGAVDITFSTTFGSWVTDNTFATGTGTLAGTLAGAPLNGTQVGAAAGVDVNVPGGDQSLIVGAVNLDDARVFAYVLVVDTDDFVPGVVLPVNDARVQLVLFDTVDGSNQGRAYDGTLTFTEASTAPGAPVVGTVHGELIQIGF